MNKLFQYVLFTAIFLYCMGYAFHWVFTPRTVGEVPVESGCATASSDTRALKLKLEAIAHTDYETYLKLKTDADKRKKADEILGKVMKILKTLD